MSGYQANNSIQPVQRTHYDPEAERYARFAASLDEVLADVRKMLIEKNKSYGDSATNPLRVFSKASPVEAILVRIDDKLSRLARGHEHANEDTRKDLLGYLILLEMMRRKDKAQGGP